MSKQIYTKGRKMSVLVIGADEITPIKAVLYDLGAKKVALGRAQRKPREP